MQLLPLLLLHSVWLVNNTLSLPLYLGFKYSSWHESITLILPGTLECTGHPAAAEQIVAFLSIVFAL